MTARDHKNTVDRLKKIIEMNGPLYLEKEPYKVYADLINSGAADRKTAAGILYFFVSGAMSSVDSAYNAEQISEVIRRECGLNKRMADRLALILSSLYSGDHRREWEKMDLKGLREFLTEDFSCNWKGFAAWDAGNGTVDCHYEARIILAPTKRISEDKELTRELKKNPYMAKEAIRELFARRLQDYLDREFDDYCTCEDYYQPVVEDFEDNLDYDLQKWCIENGFEYVSCDGNGYDDGYEPKFRNNWH